MIALDRIGGTQMSGIIEGAVPVMQLVMTVHVLCCNVLYILYYLKTGFDGENISFDVDT